MTIFFFFILFFSAIIFRTILKLESEVDISNIISLSVSTFSIENGISMYIIGVIFGIFYFEYNYQIILDENIKLDVTYYKVDIDSSEKKDQIKNESYSDSSIGIVSYHPPRKHSINLISPFKSFIKGISKSNLIQNWLMTIGILIYLFFVLYDFFVLFPKFLNKVNYSLNLFEKLYTFFQLEFTAILVFFIIFKFVIFRGSPYKRFLEKEYWIPFSRIFFTTTCLLCPVSYYLLLNLQYNVPFSYYNLFMLSISILIFLSFFASIINLILEVPLKVGFKKLLRWLLKIKEEASED